MAVRAKFTVTQVTTYHGGNATITMEPRYDSSIPEDQRFYEATPTGKFEMYVSNPAAIEQFKPGKVFYADFTEAPEGTSPYHQ